MKVRLLFTIVVFLYCSSLFAQENFKSKQINIWVQMLDNSKNIKGVFGNTTSNELEVIDKSGNSYSIPYMNLKVVKVRKQGKVGNSMLLGGGIGFLSGGVAGLISGTDHDREVEVPNFFTPGTFTYTVEGKKASTKALEGGAALGVLGVGVGAIIGSKKHRFKIEGNKDHYEELRNYLSTIK